MAKKNVQLQADNAQAEASAPQTDVAQTAVSASQADNAQTAVSVSAAAHDDIFDAVIIGGGPAGLTAALYLARARYRGLVVEREQFGGQITITSEVVNYPGVYSTSGSELTDTMRRQAEAFGAEMRLAEVESLDMSGDIKLVHTSRGDIRCLAVLLATGASPRSAGFEGEEEFKGHGVAYCATCDGEFFQDREVYVVGGGFAAAEEAVFLTKYASHVTVLVATDDFTCAAATAEATRNHPKISVRTNAQLLKVEGTSLVRSLSWKDTKTGEIHHVGNLEGDPMGVFVFVGYAPATSLVEGLATLDEQGYVLCDAHQMTKTTGLFAAGDVCQKRLRQVATAIGEGAATATEMERFLKQAQERTGIVPKQPVTRMRSGAGAAAGAAAAMSAAAGAASGASAGGNAAAPSSGAASPASSSSNSGPFDAQMLEQLAAVFARMKNPLILRLHLDDSKVSHELQSYTESLAQQSELLSLSVADTHTDSVADLPYVEVLRGNGEPSGLAFHGVPGGHEFTSFVLGLYNVAGPGQPISESDLQSIKSIERPIHMKVLVGLSCTMCPEVVVATQRMAAENPLVTADVYDINCFPKLREQYDVMSVPCLVVEDASQEKVTFGKKNLSQVLSFVG